MLIIANVFNCLVHSARLLTSLPQLIPPAPSLSLSRGLMSRSLLSSLRLLLVFVAPFLFLFLASRSPLSWCRFRSPTSASRCLRQCLLQAYNQHPAEKHRNMAATSTPAATHDRSSNPTIRRGTTTAHLPQPHKLHWLQRPHLTLHTCF